MENFSIDGNVDAQVEVLPVPELSQVILRELLTFDQLALWNTTVRWSGGEEEGECVCVCVCVCVGGGRRKKGEEEERREGGRREGGREGTRERRGGMERGKE